jgi:hypothetical protein
VTEIIAGDIDAMKSLLTPPSARTPVIPKNLEAFAPVFKGESFVLLFIGCIGSDNYSPMEKTITGDWSPKT